MAHLVDDRCINCRHTTCVSVCPVDCFYEGENMLVINPSECIDCGVCIPECPEEAIYQTDDVNDPWYNTTNIFQKYGQILLNREHQCLNTVIGPEKKKAKRQNILRKGQEESLIQD